MAEGNLVGSVRRQPGDGPKEQRPWVSNGRLVINETDGDYGSAGRYVIIARPDGGVPVYDVYCDGKLLETVATERKAKALARQHRQLEKRGYPFL